ncbi:MAG: DUF4347 domain-containing protein, partial [Chlorobiaceae bacterium]|nr:DUF4347 domain-containing protein [Chlorobiaceae bacterium]
MAKSWVFIDSRVSDREQLIAQFAPGTRYLVLDESRDGIGQIVSALGGESGYDSIQIISHGSPGSLTLGSIELNRETLGLYATQLAVIGNTLTDTGDLLLYGCNVAADQKGEQFVNALSQMTGADVAASDDKTGSEATGGDWALETRSGQVETTSLNVTEYQGSLGADSQIPAGLVNPPYSWAGISFTYRVNGEITTSDPLNTFRSGCYWDRYELTGVANGTAVYLYMGNSSTVDDYLQIERSSVMIAYNDDGGDGERGYDSYLSWSYLAGDVIRATTYSAGNTGTYSLYTSTGILNDIGDNNLGTVTFTGTSTQGETLTAQPPTDADGVTAPVNYRWQISPDNSAWTTISGVRGEAATLTLDQSESHQYVRVQAFYTDGKGRSESPASASQFVADVPDPGQLSITGMAVAGHSLEVQELSDVDGLLMASPLYQWQFSGDGNTGWTNIDGANNDSYILAHADAGYYFRLLTTYTDDMGYNETDVTSNVMGVVNPNAVPVISDFSRFGDEGTVISFSEEDFGNHFTDGNGDSLYDIQISSVPENGLLWVNGVEVTPGLYLSLSELSGLSFVPDASWHGITGFSWQASDGIDSSDYASVEIVVIDKTPPVFLDSAPFDNATDVAVDSSLELYFDEDVMAGSGYLIVSNDFGDYRSINVQDGSQVSFSGSMLTINPLNLLRTGRLYSVQMSAGVVLDIAGNFFAGISDPTVLNFETAPNTAPILTVFSNEIATTLEDTEATITIEALKAQGDEADAEGAIDGFVVSSVSSGSLKIGTDAASATPFDALTNNSIDATHKAFWTGAENTNGVLDAFMVVAKDIDGALSDTPIQAVINVTAVNDLPVLTTFDAAIVTTSEDTTTTITFDALKAQGDEADVDGTVVAFVVKSLSGGTLKIGLDAASATPWNATTNKTIDAAHTAFWTPAADANGALNAFTVVAKDDSGAESVGAVQVRVEITPVNDAPELGVGADGLGAEGAWFNHVVTLGDPDPDSHLMTVNWGDGTGNTQFDSGMEHTLTLSHFYADNGTFTVTVTADDQQGEANSVETQDFQVAVSNVAPTAQVTGNDRVNEGASYLLHVGAVADPGSDSRTAYSIDWGDGSSSVFTPVEWAAAAGEFSHIYNIPGAVEVSHTITVHTTDEDGPFVLGSRFVTVNVPPSNLSISNDTIAENTLGGTVVGTLSTSDAGAHTYTLTDNADGRFALSGNQILVAPGAILDYESNTSHTIRVRSTDTEGLSFDKELSIHLLDMGPDLLVTDTDSTQSITTIDAGSSMEIFWTVSTSGTEQTNATWVDRVYFDNPATPGLDRWIGDYSVSMALPLADALTRIQTVQLPWDMFGDFRIVVLTDNNNQVREGTAGEGNNTTYGDTLYTILNANLQVASITAPSSAFTGREIEVEWIVGNVGNTGTDNRYWYDALYLSSDAVLDGTDVRLATVRNESYLEAGEQYHNIARVTLPSGIEGEYHILVKTDVNNSVPEGGFENDNVTSSAVLDIQPIPLSELSDLAVVSVAAPVQALSGQNMSITYTIDNAGQAAIAGSSPYWVERIYMSSDEVLDGSDRLLGTIWRDLGAAQIPQPENASHFTTTEKVVLPVGVSGGYYFFVTVSPVGSVTNVFTSNDSAYDATPVDVRLTPPPDLQVSGIASSATAVAGHDLTVSYRVINTGATTTPNSGWYDALYLSANTTLDAGDSLLSEVWHSGQLAPAGSAQSIPLADAMALYASGAANGYYINTVNVHLNDALSGTWYLIAKTDTRDMVFELDNVDNTGDAVALGIESRPADLVVSEVAAASVVQAGQSLRVSWSVLNQGVGDTAASQWYDRIVLSNDTVFGDGDDVVLGTYAHSGILGVNKEYSNSAQVSIPSNLSGSYQLFVTTDIYSQVYEAAKEDNNSRPLGVGIDWKPGDPIPDGGIETKPQPTADLQVVSVTVPDRVNSGEKLSVAFTVTNAGQGSTNSNYWWDKVILSGDALVGNGDDVVLGTVYHANTLSSGESYSASASLTIPVDYTGEYHVFVRTDSNGNVTETGAENNNSAEASNTTTIDLSPVPDLVMSSASAADEGVSGRDLAVSWTVRNDGAATTGNWRQTFYLSRDGVLDRSSDIYLGYSDSVSGLGAGSEVALSASFRIPVGLSGRYYVFGVVDSGNWIYERSGENNNTVLDSTPVQITAPAPVDLVAGTISVPVNGIAGGLATIQYTVTNESAVSLSGHWRDNIYLSTDAVWDVGDALFDRVEISGPLAGSASYTQTATGTLPGLIGGDYYVIVRSDILNQVTESDETNNLSASVDSTHLDVEVLSLGIPDSDVLVKGGALYYRVDAGAGDTLLIDFDRDAGAGRTELYVSYGDMPSRSDFDYRYSVVDSPDQRIVISNAKAGSYYVMAYNTQGSADSYTITADKLVFSITEVGTDTGSNRGKVTIRIDGAELTTHTVAMLVDGDGVEHAAEKIYWKDGTELWATFDLQGMNTGVCDIRIQDGVRTAELHDGFTVNSQEVGHVEFRIETIAAMRPGQTATARIYYQNTGETDVAAPLLNISGNALLKLSGADEFGDTSLQLLGINSEGPAGILAPGAEGSFQIFFKPDFSGGGTVNLSVSTMNPDAVIDWNTILEASRPDNVSNEAWETVRANLITELGTTAGDYENNLSGIATLLDQLEGRTNDLTRLFGLDFQKASDDGNLLLPATLGVFGYSHTFAWDITAVSQSDGKVLVDLAGTKLLFTHEADGSYKLSGQGTTTLSESGGVFVLHQQNGTTITFNLDGRFSEIEDNNGHTRQAVYIDGKLGEVVTDTGGHWTYTYNEAGRLITEVDHTGRNISYAYDADNQHLLSITSPEGTKQYSYVTDGAARHLISTITGTDGTIHHYEYDGNGRLEREYLNDGAESVSYHYSGVNEVTVTDAAGVTAHFWINEDGQIAQIENARGNVTQLRYDGNGNVIETVSPDGSSSSMSYDADGKIIGTQDALGHSVAFSYEPSFGNLTQVTDQRGNAIGYGYDDRGNLNSVTYADGSSETYSYHSDGTLDIAVSRSGQNIGYTYDALGRLIQKAYADGTTASYTYDLHGNLTSATDADSAMSFEYDAANNLLKVTDVDGRWIGYAYDQAGRRIEMSDQTGREVHYSYDDEGHLSGLREADGTLIVSYQYDAAGRLSRSDNGNGTYTTYEHDIAGQLLHLVNCQQDGTVNSRFDYTYDEMGRRTSETTLDGSSTYGYDAIGQLSEVTLSSGRHIVYHYDAAGNRTYVEDNGIGSNYLVNNLNEYVSGGAVSWGYDANGNMTSRSEGGVVTTYGYDAENQLVSVARPGDIWSYEYDALGNRIASEHNGERIEYQLDPKGVASVAAEYDAAGNLAASYTYGLGLENETLADGTTAWYDFNAIGSTAGLSGSAG